MYRFVFDVDGTLTPSRQRIDPKFGEWFYKFCQEEPVFLVTGSDYPKTVEQLGQEICERVKRVYNCSGNDVWMGGKNIYSNDWKLPDEARKWLETTLINSPFSLRTGNHIEERPGCVNFSIVGRNANQQERNAYVHYDLENKEREDIARQFNYVFGAESMGLKATVGGETGLDIYPIGCDKSQIIKEFRPYDDIVFFGDKMDPGGNDYPLAQVNTKGINHHVQNWEETWTVLKKYITLKTYTGVGE